VSSLVTLWGCAAQPGAAGRRRRLAAADGEGEGGAAAAPADPAKRAGCFPPFSRWQDFELWMALGTPGAPRPGLPGPAGHALGCSCSGALADRRAGAVRRGAPAHAPARQHVWARSHAGMQPRCLGSVRHETLRHMQGSESSDACLSAPQRPPRSRQLSAPAGAGAAAGSQTLRAAAGQQASRVVASTQALPHPVRTHRWAAVNPQPACDDRCARRQTRPASLSCIVLKPL